MGCPSKVTLGEDLTFDIDVHDPTTGGSADADSLPTYRIYEDLTDTPILTGNLAKRDDANTVGSYVAQVACTAPNGFEAGKVYAIKVAATVNGETGRHTYGVLCEDMPAAVWSHTPRTLTMTGGQVVAVTTGLEAVIHRGDDWAWPVTDLGDITTYTDLWFTFRPDRRDTDLASDVQLKESVGLVYLNGASATTPANGSITRDDAVAGDITLALDKDETVNLVPKDGAYYDIQGITAAGVVRTIREGRGKITPDVTRAIA